jgi:hypothetical protein
LLCSYKDKIETHYTDSRDSWVLHFQWKQSFAGLCPTELHRSRERRWIILKCCTASNVFGNLCPFIRMSWKYPNQIKV